MHKRQDLTRRQVLVRATQAAALAPLVGPALAACGREETPAAAPAAGRAESPGTAPQAAASPPPPEPAAPAATASDDQLVTEVPAMGVLVQSLQYVNESAKPDQHCSNCLLYTARTDARGKCQLFTQGLVSAGGWCSSWQKRPQA